MACLAGVVPCSRGRPHAHQCRLIDGAEHCEPLLLALRRGNLVRSNNAEVQMVSSAMSMEAMRESRWCSSRSLSVGTFRLGSCATCSEADQWVTQAAAGECRAVVVAGAGMIVLGHGGHRQAAQLGSV